MSCTRREFGKLTLASLPAATVLGRAESIFGAVAQKPNSMIAGVQIGVIVPYSFGQEASDAETILKYVTQIGISGVEMMNPPAEAFAGAPAPVGRGGGRPGGPSPGTPGAGPGGRGGRGDGRGGGRPELTSEQQAEQRARAEELKKWRLSVPMDKYTALRKLYTDAGVKIYAMWDEAMSQSKYNGINLDTGHYVAGTSQSPIPLIQKHHDRIMSMHLKDRKKDNGPNMPWGQGDTPLAEILQLMKKEKYKFPATIELEYPVPEGSTRVAEIGKCFEFCKRALGTASTTSASRQG